jgi:Asp-tRNA(Asn)/Glu-tRNA(Gln) amidotransferase A subunit family amidase
MIDTLRLTAEDALGLLERKEVSAAELHAAYLEAIASRDGTRSTQRITEEITADHREKPASRSPDAGDSRRCSSVILCVLCVQRGSR